MNILCRMSSICPSTSSLHGDVDLGGSVHGLLLSAFQVASPDVRTTRRSDRGGEGEGPFNCPAPSSVGGEVATDRMHPEATIHPVGQLCLYSSSTGSSDFPFPSSPQAPGSTPHCFQPRILQCPCGFPIYPVHTSANSSFVKFLTSHPIKVYHLFLAEMRKLATRGAAGQGEPRR